MTRHRRTQVSQKRSNSGIQETQVVQVSRAVHVSREARPHSLVESRESKEARAVAVALELVRELAYIPPQDQPKAWQLIFLLARRLQREFGVASDDLLVFQPAVKAFCNAVVEAACYQACTGVDLDDLEAQWLEFVAVWFKVQMPEGDGPLELAYQYAVKHPFAVQPAFSEAFVRFVNTACYLQQLRDDDPILLPVKRVGALFGRGEMFGSRLVSVATDAGFLRVVDSAFSYRRHKAKTYRFVYERVGFKKGSAS